MDNPRTDNPEYTVFYTRAVHKETELFFLNLLLYLQLNQKCLLQSTPHHSRYTAPNVFSSSRTRPGKCFFGDGAKVACRIFFYILYRLKSATF